MRPVTILLVAYCLAAAVALGVWAWNAVARTRELADHLAVAEQELAGLDSIVDTKLQHLRELEARQREGRKTFSGPEAVDASYAVQMAQAELDRAESDLAEADRELGALEREHDSQSKLVVPLIAGVLLHLIFGLSLIRSGPPPGRHSR
jgi:flagellar motility protein MotE (MotC chaperone)